jgi:hypothetical protein
MREESTLDNGRRIKWMEEECSIIPIIQLHTTVSGRRTSFRGKELSTMKK